MEMNLIAEVVLKSPAEAIDHWASMGLVIGWACVLVFLFTAIVTCIALLFPHIIPDLQMRKWLYNSLLGEVVVICVLMFSGQLNPKKATATAEEAVRDARREAIRVTEAAANLNVSAPLSDERPDPPIADAALDIP